MKKYKNAGIKSNKEAAQRLIDGQVFCWGEYDLVFNDTWANPFRSVNGLTNIPIDDAWNWVQEWQIEIDWRENIGKGVWCWVWSNNESLKAPALVTCYAEGRGFYSMCHWFSNAESMTEAEVMEYVLK